MPERYKDITKVDFTLTVPSQMIKSSGESVQQAPQGIRLLFIDNLRILLISLGVLHLL